MKNIKYRSIILYLLVLAFFVGIGFYIYEFVTKSNIWAFSPVNRHLSEGAMSGGKILDANDVILAQTVDGKRRYCDDEGIRKALLHTVGDGSVLIPTSVQSRYSTELFGYNFITGFGAPKILNISQNIKLTLDGSLCSSISKSFKGKKGTALAYNYLTGDILCMVSLPTYDVYSRPDLSKDNSEYEGVYLNRAISSSFTPGSIFKIFTAIAGFDSMPSVESKTFECNKEKLVNGEKVVCMEKHGKINLKNGFSKSCDIVFGDIGYELGKSVMKSKMEEYGFNKPEHFDGMEIAKSEYKVENASGADLCWSAIGQYTDKVCPMHMLKVMGAIANEGICVEPKIIKAMSSNSSVFNSAGLKTSSKKIFNSESSQKVRELMRYAVKSHYGDANFGKAVMCAKTGTAEVGEEKEPHSWMVGFSYDKTFPIAFVVMVENGGFGIKTAGSIAFKMIKELYSNFSTNKYS